jgi:alpha-glucosidase
MIQRIVLCLVSATVILGNMILGNIAWAETVSSPSGDIKVTVDSSGGLAYRVEAFGKEVIGRSPLALEFEGLKPLGPKVKIVKTTTRSNDKTWKPVVAGRRSEIRDHYNELTLQLKEKAEPGRRFGLRVRAFDNGVAFRYEFPKQKAMPKFELAAERSCFNFPADATCWAAKYAGFVSHQEEYYSKIPLSEIKATDFVGGPLLVKAADDLWLAISEAALVDYAGMYLAAVPASKGDGVTLVTRLAEQEGVKHVVSSSTPMQTPWRFIMIAKQPVKLLENDMMLCLNEPCAIKDPSWIDPGPMAWDHWWSRDVKMDTATIKKYIQLAADMGWKYQLIDWQWYGPFNKPDSDITTVAEKVDMDEVRRFAKEKGVKLWLWLYWTDADRDDAYIKAFELYENWGIVGVKIDFMQRDDQQMVNWYHKIVKKAAEHKLMVDFHGAYKPTGWRRTYPNLMTREGVLGNEWNGWTSKVTPEHKCTIAFTRNLLGEMDYTPGGFLNRTAKTFKPERPTQTQGTRAQELALFVIYESPLLCVCDHPDNYRDQPGVDFLKIVPTTWDETLGIGGQVGEFITVAKRKGDQWYLGTITNWTAREQEIPLDFLGPGTYEATIWRDGPAAAEKATDMVRETRTVTSEDSLKLQLAPGGGAAVRLVPKK